MSATKRVLLALCSLLVLIVGSIAVSTYLTWSAKRDADQEQRYRDAKAEADSLRVRYERVVKASKIDSTRLATLEAQSLGLQVQIARRADSARLKGVQNDALGIPKSAVDTLWKTKFQLAEGEISDLKAENALLSQLHLNDTTRLLITATRSTAWQEVAHTAVLSVVPNLVNVATEQHDRRDCAILRFIPCPSRKVAGVTGAILGAVLVPAVKALIPKVRL